MKGFLQYIRPLKNNFFQRMSFFFILIVLVMSSFMLLLFSNLYSFQAKRSINESLRQMSIINAQSAASIFERINLSLNTVGMRTSRLHETLEQYNGSVFSDADTLESAKALLEQYIDPSIRPITLQYHTYLFTDPSYAVSGRLPVLHNIDQLNGATWVYSDRGIREADWFQLACASPGENHWFIPPDQPSLLCVAHYIQYYDIIDNHVQLVTPGMLLIVMNNSWINKMIDFSSLTSRTYYLLSNGSGNILYASQPSWIGNSFSALTGTEWNDRMSLTELSLDGTAYILTFTQCTDTFTLTVMVPEISLQREQRVTKCILFAGMFLCSLIGCCMVFYFSRKISKPIMRLSHHMRHHDLTLIESRKREYSDDDIMVLYNSYNDMTVRICKAIEDKTEMLRKEKVLELNLLQAQVSPHFLCNALNSICCVAMLHQETDIADASAALATFLRYNISSPDAEVLLQREIESAESYVKIQNFLYPDTVSFTCETDLDMESYLTPKMLLQPLIENCVKYGAADSILEITVTPSVQDDVLRIVVEDNGIGCDVDAINATLDDSPYANKEHGFGIRNVHQRIVMKYNHHYGLHYSRCACGGVRVTITLPARTTDQHSTTFTLPC